MKKSAILTIEDDVVSSIESRRTVKAKYVDGVSEVASSEVWFSVKGSGAGTRNYSADFAVLSSIFSAMRWGRDIEVWGPVSRDLLINLEEFQHVFCSWFPRLYSHIDIKASEIDRSECDKRGPAVAAFSGGVDACFTTFRNYHRTPGKYHYDIKSVMLVHGFDVPINNPKAFKVAEAGARKILDGMDIDFITVKTNLKHRLPDWEQNFAAGIAACFNAIGPGFSYGLIGSDEPYSALELPWGSNPISNHFLSTGRTRIVTDGGGYTRTEKVSHIAKWPGAFNNVRVCWEGPETGENCGRCEKCRRTILNFRAAGVSQPPAFPVQLKDEDIAAIPLRNRVQIAYMQDVYRKAVASGIADTWVTSLRALLSKHNAVPKVSAIQAAPSKAVPSSAP